VISFDIGIKNMAYCIFDISPGNPITIHDWNVLNLLDDAPTVPLCTSYIEVKKKKVLEKTDKKCSKKAKFEKDGQCFCEKHALTSQLLLPKKEFSPSSLNIVGEPCSLLNLESFIIIYSEKDVVVELLSVSICDFRKFYKGWRVSENFGGINLLYSMIIM
jgi:hypothetical protein